MPDAKVWEHFDRVVVRAEAGAGPGRGRGRGGDGPLEQARCKHCPKTYQVRKGGTASLRYHLKNAHGRVFAEMLRDEVASKRQREEEVEEVEEAERAQIALAHETPRKRLRRSVPEGADREVGASADRPGTLDRYRKYASGDRRQLSFDMSVTQYLVSSALPFSHVESQSFQSFIQSLNPRVTVKSANTFSQSKLPRLHSAMVRSLKKVLDSDLVACPGGALTTDIWTSRSGDPFVSLTLHYLSDWVLKRWTLGCLPFEGRHTAHRVAEALDGKLTEFPILEAGLQFTLVHDAASNMKAACPKSAFSLTSLVCVDHRLQTVLRTSFSEITLLDDLMSKCVAIAARMHRSPLTCQLVRDECQQVGAPYVKVVIPVETRWNSKYGMVQSLNTIRQGLESLRDRRVNLAVGSGLGPDHLTEEEWDLLKDIETILFRFDVVSKELSGDKSVTICQVMPHLFNLLGYCQRDQTRPDCPEGIRELSQKLERNLVRQFPDCGAGEQAIAMGNLLHPYFKGTFLKKYGVFDATLVTLETLFAPPSPAGSPPGSHGGTPNQPGASLDFFGDDLDPTDALMREMTQGESLAPEKSKFQAEVEAYMSMPRPLTRGECDVLLWWKDHEGLLPILSQAARYFLSVPASSASSERLWSVAGNIVTAKRYSLDPATTERLTFCQSNWQNLKAHGWSIDKEMEEAAAAASAAEVAEAAEAAEEEEEEEAADTPSAPTPGGSKSIRTLFKESTPRAGKRKRSLERSAFPVLIDDDEDEEIREDV